MAKQDEKEREVDALLDQLLAGLSPEEVMGREGLMRELQKRIMERMLEGELTAHLVGVWQQEGAAVKGPGFLRPQGTGATRYLYDALGALKEVTLPGATVLRYTTDPQVRGSGGLGISCPREQLHSYRGNA